MRPILLLPLLLASHSVIAQPNASFTASRHKVCDGSTVQLTNTSTGANSYKWYINKTLVSTTLNYSVIITIGDGPYQPVMLVAENTAGGKPDTAKTVLEAIGNVAMHMTGDFSACVGDTIRLRAHHEAVASTWTIDPPHQPVAGCLNCDSVYFVLEELGTMADLVSQYDGGCFQKSSYHYGWCNKPSGIDDTKQPGWRIYPNPAAGELTIEKAIAGTQVTIYNVLGQHVYSGVLNANKEVIDISAFVPGGYVLQLIEPGGSSSVVQLQKQ